MTSPLRSLIRLDGLRPIIGATEDRLMRLLLDPDDDHPSLNHYVEHIASTDMKLLEKIISNSDFVARQPEWSLALLRQAFAQTQPGAQRQFLRRLAAQAGLSKKIQEPDAVDLTALTPSQCEVFFRLRATADVFFAQAGAPPSAVKPRLNPLVIGASGTGKTYLANLLGQALGGIPVFSFGVSNWIVQGARQEPTTLEMLRDALDANDRIVVFIDELDKYRSEDTSWSLAQLTELFSVLDRRVQNSGTSKKAWTASHTQKLRDSAFIVGAGAWQWAWTTSIGRSLGFQQTTITGDEIAAKVRAARAIPEELLYRFSHDWLVLEPYRAATFAAIAERLALPAGVIDPVAGEHSGRNFRYIEDRIAAHQIELRLRTLRRDAVQNLARTA